MIHNNKAIDILDNLTPEEKEILSRIESKLAKALQEAKDTRYDHLDSIENNNPDFTQKHPELLHPKVLTRGPYEITVTVKAEVSEVDSKGYLSDNISILEKFYHIPIKAKEDYQVYLNKFFDIFHRSLENTCQDLNTNNNDDKS